MSSTREIRVENEIFLNYSEKKKEILLYIKKNQNVGLLELAEFLGLTKMGVLKHIRELEDKGIIDRFKKKEEKSVGRPKVYFRLADKGVNLFPKAYTALTCSFIDYINDKLGKKGVMDAFDKRKEEVYKQYKKDITGDDLDTKVRELASVRDDDGYMVELKVFNDSYELLEYNCPIVSVAEKYSEACITENNLFQELLNTKVEISHRIVAGDQVCRFMIQKYSL